MRDVTLLLAAGKNERGRDIAPNRFATHGIKVLFQQGLHAESAQFPVLHFHPLHVLILGENGLIVHHGDERFQKAAPVGV